MGQTSKKTAILINQKKKMKTIILAGFVTLSLIATAEAASGFSYFYTPRRGSIGKSSAPVHHSYKPVAHPYPVKTHTYVAPKKINTYVAPKKIHTYVAPQKTKTYSAPKKTYGYKLVGPKYSGEKAEPSYKVAKPTDSEIEEEPFYDYEQRQIEIEEPLEDVYDIADLGSRNSDIA